ncbi:MAG: hypothetical protein JSW66_04755 [Phycisphaerales bacterium]|nr:MAG: hypothetical protein JSW66_04755 [Phycisphaerales bacterium]
MSDVTRILNAIEGGNPKAADELFPLVYEELRRRAAQQMAKERPGQTLQATALVHEAYIRLAEGQNPNWSNRGYFFKAASKAMGRILVENARRKKSLKYGGDRQRLELTARMKVLTDRAGYVAGANSDMLRREFVQEYGQG